LKGFAEMSDILSVESICFSQASGGPGKLPHLSGVAHDNRQPGLVGATDEFHLKAACGLDEDPKDLISLIADWIPAVSLGTEKNLSRGRM
jgi:hypothetical protein